MSDLTVIETAGTDDASYVDWPAIIAGIAVASGISLVLLTFGSAIGLSFANFRAPTGVNPIWIAIAAASWLLWVQVSSFMSGAYLTGRMRRRHNDSTEHESDVRDGAHGLIVWGGALVIGAIIAAGGIGAVANTIGSAASTLTNAASNVAGGVADEVDPNAYFTDMLFRPAPSGTAEDAATAEPAASTTTTTTVAPVVQTPTAAPATAAPSDTSAVRAEAGRIFLQTATGPVPDADKAYLGQLVADNTGLPPDQATARVDEVIAAMDDAKAKAAEVAETARKTAVLAAFLTAASLLVSAAGAFWAAQMGGNHRDKQTIFPGFGRR